MKKALRKPPPFRAIVVAGVGLAFATLVRPALADPVHTGTVELGKSTLFYRDAGKGHPVVFVHALLTDSRTWDDQLLGLSDRRRLLAPDLSGQGFSSPWHADKISSEAYADELLEFIDAMKLREPADLVGLSGGGSSGPSIANRRYSLVASMQIRNLTNHNNPGPIIGNITSPLFGQANQPARSGGGIFSESANNRRLELQIRFTF